MVWKYGLSRLKGVLELKRSNSGCKKNNENILGAKSYQHGSNAVDGKRTRNVKYRKTAENFSILPRNEKPTQIDMGCYRRGYKAKLTLPREGFTNQCTLCKK